MSSQESPIFDERVAGAEARSGVAGIARSTVSLGTGSVLVVVGGSDGGETCAGGTVICGGLSLGLPLDAPPPTPVTSKEQPDSTISKATQRIDRCYSKRDAGDQDRWGPYLFAGLGDRRWGFGPQRLRE